MLSSCLSFLSIAVETAMTKSNLVRKGFISAYSLQSAMKESNKNSQQELGGKK